MPLNTRTSGRARPSQTPGKKYFTLFTQGFRRQVVDGSTFSRSRHWLPVEQVDHSKQHVRRFTDCGYRLSNPSGRGVNRHHQ